MRRMRRRWLILLVALFVILVGIQVAPVLFGQATRPAQPTQPIQPTRPAVKPTVTPTRVVVFMIDGRPVKPGQELRITTIEGAEDMAVNLWAIGTTRVACKVKQGSLVVLRGEGIRVYLGGEMATQPLVRASGTCIGLVNADWLELP